MANRYERVLRRSLGLRPEMTGVGARASRGCGQHMGRCGRGAVEPASGGGFSLRRGNGPIELGEGHAGGAGSGYQLFTDVRWRYGGTDPIWGSLHSNAPCNIHRAGLSSRELRHGIHLHLRIPRSRGERVRRCSSERPGVNPSEETIPHGVQRGSSSASCLTCEDTNGAMSVFEVHRPRPPETGRTAPQERCLRRGRLWHPGCANLDRRRHPH